MRYTKDEIIQYVREVFGQGYIEGAFISIDAVEGDIGPEDDEIMTGFSPDSYLVNFGDEEEDFRVFMGMTKLVIVPKNSDYVIKIPFTGYYEWDDAEEEDEDGISYWEDRTNFRIAGYLQGSNVCDVEMEKYEWASGTLQEILLPNEFIGKVDGLDVYVQEKYKMCFADSICACEGSYFKTLNPAKRQIIRKLFDENHEYIGAAFIGSLIEQFGIGTTQKVLAELLDYDDLHPGNYGYTRDGRCVVFDYAGYSGDYYSVRRGAV